MMSMLLSLAMLAQADAGEAWGTCIGNSADKFSQEVGVVDAVVDRVMNFCAPQELRARKSVEDEVTTETARELIDALDEMHQTMRLEARKAVVEMRAARQ